MLRVSGRVLQRLVALGIETSCDDTAVAVVDSDRKVLYEKRFVDRELQRSMGGISPEVVAKQHREHLPRLVDKCLQTVDVDDVDLIAVTTRPGLVIALKEGIKVATQLAKKHKKDLVEVHHMRAHALSALLASSNQNASSSDVTVSENLPSEPSFPFLTVLLSGGHAIFSLVKSPTDFAVLGTSESGSPGECLDKLGRELDIQDDFPDLRHLHPGAAVEIIARRASELGHLRYSVPGPSTPRAMMNFSQLKAGFLMVLRKQKKQSDFSSFDFAASVQESSSVRIVKIITRLSHFVAAALKFVLKPERTICTFDCYRASHHIARHICSRLHACLESLRAREQEEPCLASLGSAGVTDRSSSLRSSRIQHAVISGGVAANQYIQNAIGKVLSYHGLEAVHVPARLCTDNAEMIAYTAILQYQNLPNSNDIHRYPNIPEMLYAHARQPIGNDQTHMVSQRPVRRLSMRSLHGDEVLKTFGKEDFKLENQ